MNYEDIKTYAERCNSHPEHDGIVTHQMVEDRLLDEIEELRAYIETKKWQGLTDYEINNFDLPESGTVTIREFVRIIEAKLKEKNT